MFGHLYCDVSEQYTNLLEKPERPLKICCRHIGIIFCQTTKIQIREVQILSERNRLSGFHYKDQRNIN